MHGTKARFSGRVTRRDFLKATGAAVAGLAFAECGQASASVKPLRFGLVTDCHYADREPAGSRCYRDSLAKLEDCVGFMNERSLDFLIELGDFKDQGSPPVEEETLGYLRQIEDVFQQFKAPRFHALGNHDMDSISKAQLMAHVKNTGIPAGRTYYSFDVKGVHAVVLDANHLQDGSDYDHGKFDWTDPNVPPVELDWLRRDLAAVQSPVLVFLHQRLDGEGDVFVTNASAVRAALEESGKVLAVFQGHHHEGACTRLNGIHYYTLKALVDGPGRENNAYAIAELDGAGNITVTGHGRAVSTELARELPADSS